MKRETKIVAFSDTHTYHRTVKVPDGDVLVFAGDLMSSGYRHEEVKDFADWFMSQPHDHKVLVAGNHDRMFESNLEYCLSKFTKRLGNFVYLQDSGINIRGWNFWGSPYQPEFCNWAFNKYRGPDIKQHWDKIPNDTDILITHGPPRGFGDQMGMLYGEGKWAAERVGCDDLLDAVKRVKPTAHFFGHIHNGRGIYLDTTDNEKGISVVNPDLQTSFHNVAICSEAYEPDGACQTLWLGERE